MIYDCNIKDKIDSIIVSNNFLRDEINKYFSKEICKTIYHHWDPRYKNIIYKPSHYLKIGYIGSVTHEQELSLNLYCYKELIKDYDIQIINSRNGENVTDQVRQGNVIYNHVTKNNIESINTDINCHLSLRDENSSEFYYKTNAKVSTASALLCPIITTKEKGITDLLSEDYPYFVQENSFSDVKRTIEHVCLTYKKEEWYRAIEIMKKIKYRTSIDVICDDYVELFTYININNE